LVAGDYITTEQEQYILSEDYKDGEPNDAYEEISRDITKDPYIFEGYINANGTVIINFPVKEKEFTKSKFDVSIWEQMAIVREMQYWWSDNSVSVTVTIREHEKEELARAIEFYAPYVKTLSFLPLTDHRYDQAPYQEVSEGALDDYIKTIKTLDLSNTAESVKGSKFCTNDSCEI
jgi:ribonucleoside-diphosphate reductase alpha chain